MITACATWARHCGKTLTISFAGKKFHPATVASASGVHSDLLRPIFLPRFVSYSTTANEVVKVLLGEWIVPTPPLLVEVPNLTHCRFGVQRIITESELFPMYCPRELIRVSMATKPAIVIYSAFVFVETESALSAKVPSVHCSPHIMRFLRYRGRIASRETHSAIGGSRREESPRGYNSRISHPISR